MSVEEIQDCVEMELMKSPRKEVAKKYIAYRNQRSMARNAKSNEIFQEIIDAQATDITRENANMNADTPAGMMMKFASEATKSYVDNCLLSEDVREAVMNGYIHIHDKDYYPTKSLTCIQHPLDKILECGLKAGHGESRPAKRIETASVLACISMETVQNEMPRLRLLPGPLCPQDLPGGNQETLRPLRQGLLLPQRCQVG
jgi:ribonucleoside-triphosphate reductase